MIMQSACFFVILLLGLASTNVSIAQDTSSNPSADHTGKLRVHVMPEEAYIWVDGKPMSHRTSTLKLPAGEHKIGVYNYGYLPLIQNVNVAGGQEQEITADLQRVERPVSGPWGRIQIEGTPGDALVFLNGTTPEFFVGHADEMNNHIFADQQLVVPVGTHQVHVLANKTGQEIWSGPVEVKENERVIIYTKQKADKQLVYKHWPAGAKFNSLKRFEASTATASIAVAPVKAKLAVDRPDIKCGEPVRVSWEATDAPVTSVKANDQMLSEKETGAVEDKPKQNTKYELHVAGPGGIATSDAGVNVDKTVTASLTPATPELRYVKKGDIVKEQGSTELKWTASNADSITIDPIGPVSGRDGSRVIQASPSQNNPGPINETVTYKLTATNVCGGSATETASVRITGSIAPEVAKAEPPPEPLPATASDLPLLALLGTIFLGAGAIVRRFRTR